jgi:hypothetical protein
MLATLSSLDWLYEQHNDASDELSIFRLSQVRQNMHLCVITICQMLTGRK